MNKRRLPLVLVFAALWVAGVSAQTAVGVVSYVEGTVTVSRNGEVLPAGTVDIGLSIEEFDTVETEGDGYVEIEMTAPEAGSLVKVRPDTAFYFEGTPRDASQFRTTFQLLRGTLALKVGKLTNRESYGVQTDTAVMAVRGTEFTVDMAADRSVLITVPEGRVESIADTRRVMAQPGTVAFIDERSTISTAEVEPDEIELYREYWRGLRQDALRINARMSVQQYARQWDAQFARLESAMGDLASHDDIFLKWRRIAQSADPQFSTGEAFRDKRTLGPGMLELRAVLPVAERTFETLVGLEEAWTEGHAEGGFTAGNYRNAAEFYRSFQRDKAKMRRMLSVARNMIRVYRFIDRSAGSSFESAGPDIMGTTPTL